MQPIYPEKWLHLACAYKMQRNIDVVHDYEILLHLARAYKMQRVLGYH